MSTNFYLKKQKEDDLENSIHIGQRAGGWQFLFNPYRKSGKAWINLLKRNKDLIYDEYDRNIDIQEFLKIISLDGYNGSHKASGKTVSVQEYNGHWKDHEFFDREGYRISKHNDFS